MKAAMRAVKLSYVPVTKPNNATTRMQRFFRTIQGLTPFDELQAHTISTSGGKMSARADEHSAPINEMKEFSTGTISASESGNGEKVVEVRNCP